MPSRAPRNVEPLSLLESVFAGLRPRCFCGCDLTLRTFSLPENGDFVCRVEARHGPHVRRVDKAFSDYALFGHPDPVAMVREQLLNACRMLKDECPEKQVQPDGLVRFFYTVPGHDGRMYQVPVPATPRLPDTMAYGTIQTRNDAPASTPAPQQVSTTQKPKPEIKARTVTRRLLLPTNARPV